MAANCLCPSVTQFVHANAWPGAPALFCSDSTANSDTVDARQTCAGTQPLIPANSVHGPSTKGSSMETGPAGCEVESDTSHVGASSGSWKESASSPLCFSTPRQSQTPVALGRWHLFFSWDWFALHQFFSFCQFFVRLSFLKSLSSRLPVCERLGLHFCR
jgi:hypothetical protein